MEREREVIYPLYSSRWCTLWSMLREAMWALWFASINPSYALQREQRIVLIQIHQLLTLQSSKCHMSWSSALRIGNLLPKNTHQFGVFHMFPTRFRIVVKHSIFLSWFDVGRWSDVKSWKRKRKKHESNLLLCWISFLISNSQRKWTDKILK